MADCMGEGEEGCVCLVFSVCVLSVLSELSVCVWWGVGMCGVAAVVLNGERLTLVVRDGAWNELALRIIGALAVGEG